MWLVEGVFGNFQRGGGWVGRAESAESDMVSRWVGWGGGLDIAEDDGVVEAGLARCDVSGSAVLDTAALKIDF